MMCRNQNAKEQLLKKINEASFAVEDILLYLDTHPCDQTALSFYEEQVTTRKRLMAEYAASYGPLTIDDAVESSGSTWTWMEQPFPWEQEGGCR